MFLFVARFQSFLYIQITKIAQYIKTLLLQWHQSVNVLLERNISMDVIGVGVPAAILFIAL